MEIYGSRLYGFRYYFLRINVNIVFYNNFQFNQYLMEKDEISPREDFSISLNKGSCNFHNFTQPYFNGHFTNFSNFFVISYYYNFYVQIIPEKET